MVDLLEWVDCPPVDFYDEDSEAEGRRRSRVSSGELAATTSVAEGAPSVSAVDDTADLLSALTFLTSVGEKIPLLNSGLQQFHQLVGNEEALRRAQQEDPIGPNGYLTQVAEHVPLVNSVLQQVFRNMGDDQALRRARDRDPIGTHGYLTQAFEHIPVISDGVAAFHKFQGEEDAYERARAHSLQNLLSKDGAITKVAELLPGSNLVAALLHQANGNEEEAARALKLHDSWAGVFTPDSPFARIFELIPGPDALAFALHVQGGYYAQALRSLAKTSWVNISIDKFGLVIRCQSLATTSCHRLEVSNIAMQPRQMSLVVGMRDVLMNFLVLDKAGHRRDGVRKSDLEHHTEKSGAFEYTQGLVKCVAQEKVSSRIAGFTHDLPEYLDWLIIALNRRLPTWRADYSFLDAAFPGDLPELTDLVKREFQRALPRASIQRVELATLRPHAAKLRRWQHASVVAESASIAGCFSMLGGLGMHAPVGGLLCMAGVACGAAELGRAALRRTARWLDAWNAESWSDVVEDRQPQWSFSRARACANADTASEGSTACSSGGSGGGSSSSSACSASPASRSASSATSSSTSRPPPSPPKTSPLPAAEVAPGPAEPHGVVVELMAEDASRLGRLVRRYYLERVLADRSDGASTDGPGRRARALLAAEPALEWLAWTVFKTKGAVVPVVLEIELDAWAMELIGFSFDAWLPSMRFAVVLHLDMAAGSPSTHRVFMVLPDELVGNVVQGFQEQIPTWDLRELDQRFAGFQRPAFASIGRLDLRWQGPSGFELVARGVRCRLDLPR